MMNTTPKKDKENTDPTKSRAVIAPTEKMLELNLPPITSPQYQARYGGTFIDVKRTRYHDSFEIIGSIGSSVMLGNTM